MKKNGKKRVRHTPSSFPTILGGQHTFAFYIRCPTPVGDVMQVATPLRPKFPWLLFPIGGGQNFDLQQEVATAYPSSDVLNPDLQGKRVAA